MNIALVNSEYPTNIGYGEIGSYVHHMALALYEEGHEVHLFFRKGTIVEKLPSEIGIHFYSRTEPTGFKNKIVKYLSGLAFWEMGYSKGLLKKIEEVQSLNKFDIVEIPDYGGLAHSFKGEFSFKLIIGFHGCLKLIHRFSNIQASIDERKFYRFETEAIRNGDLFRFPSEAQLKEAKKFFTLEDSLCRVIYNPIDISIYKKIEKTVDPDGKFHILYTGPLETMRGASVIAAAISNILAIDKKIHITFAGAAFPENQGKQGYRELIERQLSASERSRIWFTGPLDNYRQSLMYRKSDLFICPQIFGNIPHNLLEAMASGLPVVASNSGGIPEFIHHERSGMLFSLKSTKDFVDKIKLLFLSKDLRTVLTKKGAEQVENKLNSTKIVKKYLEFSET